MAFACFGVLDVRTAVPDKAPDVEFVVKNSGAPIYLSADGRVAPMASFRAGESFLVEALGDLARAETICVVLKVAGAPFKINDLAGKSVQPSSILNA